MRDIAKLRAEYSADKFPELDFEFSEYFSLKELTKTSKVEFIQRNFEAALFDTDAFGRLSELHRVILYPLRVFLGKPIHIHSCYRCPDLNAVFSKIGTKSQHVLGEAVDFHISGDILGDCKKIYEWLVGAEVEYGQIIFEQTWIHLSTANKERGIIRQKPLEMKDGKYGVIVL